MLIEWSHVVIFAKSTYEMMIEMRRFFVLALSRAQRTHAARHISQRCRHENKNKNNMCFASNWPAPVAECSRVGGSEKDKASLRICRGAFSSYAWLPPVYRSAASVYMSSSLLPALCTRVRVAFVLLTNFYNTTHTHSSAPLHVA